MSEEEAHKMAKVARTVVWIDGGLHATSGELTESRRANLQMVSRTDEETMRFRR